MEKIELSSTEKAALELRHKRCKDVKECYRINAVLLRAEGWSVPRIAQALRINKSTVSRHIKDYVKGKLKIESGGSSSSLNQEQTKELIAHLEINTYQTTLEIINHIKERYKISYSVPGINKWLHRQGFSYKKPKGYPYKASKEEQESFIEKYKALKKKIPKKDSIVFMDSCHPSMATKVSYGWIKKGQSKPIETTASRTRINLVGAISLSKLDKPIIDSYTTINGESISTFLHQLRKYSEVSGTIHLVLDRARYHLSRYVVLAAEKLNIKLVYLPAYSPNLNPIERLWKVMNEHARNNKFFKTPEEFRESISNFFSKKLPEIAHTLTSRINDNFQSLEYAFSS